MNQKAEILIHCKYDELVKVDELKPNGENPNDHTPEQVKHLAKLMTAHGIRHEIIVSKQTGMIVCGHGRLKAAQLLEMTEYPVVYQGFEDYAEEYQVMVADNGIAAQAEIDLAKVNQKFVELGPFDIDFLGLKDFVIEPADFDNSEPKADPKDKDANMMTCPACGVLIEKV